jgi:hypothetical protein
MVPNAARLLVVGGVLLAALASSSTQGERPAAPAGKAAFGGPPMDPSRALGLWSSSFGPVKIVADETGGKGAVAGVWVYDDRRGKQVIGYFEGTLVGTVLRFRWHEPGPPAVRGDGEIVFDPSGTRFGGGWSNAAGDDGGEWTGWRDAPPAASPPAAEAAEAAEAADAGPAEAIDAGPVAEPITF